MAIQDESLQVVSCQAEVVRFPTKSDAAVLQTELHSDQQLSFLRFRDRIFETEGTLPDGGELALFEMGLLLVRA